MGVKVVLSLHGSIVYEYAYFGIPSILASSNTWYNGFKFVKSVKTKKEFNNILNRLNYLNIKFTKDEIYRYYYMRYVNNGDIFNLKQKTNYLSKIGKKNYMHFDYRHLKQRFYPIVYRNWIRDINEEKHNFISNEFDKFINSKNHEMQIT